MKLKLLLYFVVIIFCFCAMHPDQVAAADVSYEIESTVSDDSDNAAADVITDINISYVVFILAAIVGCLVAIAFFSFFK